MMMVSEPLLIPLKPKIDDRGVFLPIDIPVGFSLARIKRIYTVFNPHVGTIRGFHWHEAEAKYFTILQGSAKFVCIFVPDPSFPKKSSEEIYKFVLSTRSPGLVFIPPGYANGWISLEDDTLLLALSTSTFEESISDDKRLDPYYRGDVWSVKPR